MALYRIQLRIALNEPSVSAKWSNVFYVDAPSPSVATALGLDLWDNGWRFAHSTNTFCYEVYASDLVPLTQNFNIEAHPLTAEIFGVLAGSGEYMPLFNVARGDLNVANSRSSRKFIRSPFTEGQIALDSFIPAVQAGIDVALQTVLNDPSFRDESGNDFGSFTAKGVTSKRLGKLSGVGVPSKPVVPA